MEFYKLHIFFYNAFVWKLSKTFVASFENLNFVYPSTWFFCLLHQEIMKGSSQVSKPNFIQTETNPITAFSLFFSNVCCLMLGTLIFGCMYQKKKVCAIQPEKSLHSLPLSIVTWRNWTTIKEMRIFSTTLRETPSMYLLYSLVVTSAAW